MYNNAKIARKREGENRWSEVTEKKEKADRQAERDLQLSGP